MDRGDATARDAGGSPGGGASRLLRRARHSLVVRCLAIFAGTALALVALVFAVALAGGAMFEGAFPSMDSLLEEDEALAADRFEALAARRFDRCLIVVFDGLGSRLYASSEEAARSITARDLPIIADYEASSFYEVFRETSPEGDVRHRVMLCSLDGEERVVEASCLLDEDYAILEGDLFADRGSLTEREFGFVTGLYDARMAVSRLEYETDEGEPRTLVLAAPLVSEESYGRVADAAGRLWLVAVPGVIAIAGVAAALLAREMRVASRPLDRAICAYRASGEGGATVESAEEAGVALELVPLYEDFADLMARLDESRRDGRRMVADVSHDLKTPLTVIRGYAQAFCDGCVPPEKEGSYHAAMRDKAIAAAELLDELSDYARVEHPDFQPHLELVRLGPLVSEVAGESLPVAEQAAGELVVEARAGGDAVVLADVALFRRMLRNLVENAFAHNPSGTVVRVMCSVEEGPGGVGRAVVSVADTGEGFSPDVAGRAFEPFVTDNVARTPGRGTGLGLTIARRAAELMGGSLSLSPRPEAPWGTELVVSLPLADPCLEQGAVDPKQSLRD